MLFHHFNKNSIARKAHHLNRLSLIDKARLRLHLNDKAVYLGLAYKRKTCTCNTLVTNGKLAYLALFNR